MRLLKSVTMFGMLAGFGVSALADNPISAYHYLADPGAASDDTYFYVITDSDDPAVANANGYDIKALYGFRTKDMKNWTDFGIIYDARKVSGIGDIWDKTIYKLNSYLILWYFKINYWVSRIILSIEHNVHVFSCGLYIYLAEINTLISSYGISRYHDVAFLTYVNTCKI